MPMNACERLLERVDFEDEISGVNVLHQGALQCAQHFLVEYYKERAEHIRPLVL